MGNKYVNIEGRTFGRYTVIEEISVKGEDGIKRKYCLCRCECGTLNTIRRDVLMASDSLSCGCLRREKEEKRLEKVLEGELLIQQGIIPYDYALEREPDLIIRRIRKLQKVSEKEATKKYKDWRNAIRKGKVLNIC